MSHLAITQFSRQRPGSVGGARGGQCVLERAHHPFVPELG